MVYYKTKQQLVKAIRENMIPVFARNPVYLVLTETNQGWCCLDREPSEDRKSKKELAELGIAKYECGWVWAECHVAKI